MIISTVFSLQCVPDSLWISSFLPTHNFNSHVFLFKLIIVVSALYIHIYICFTMTYTHVWQILAYTCTQNIVFKHISKPLPILTWVYLILLACISTCEHKLHKKMDFCRIFLLHWYIPTVSKINTAKQILVKQV